MVALGELLTLPVAVFTAKNKNTDTMPQCEAFGCNFLSKGNKRSAVSLHYFPSDKKRRKEREEVCGRIKLNC